jgi:hypothetical protein
VLGALYAGRVAFEHEQLDREIGVLTVGAEKRLDGAMGQTLDGVNEANLHAVLPGHSRLAHFVPLASLEQRLFGGGVAAGEHDDEEVGLQVGAAVGRSASEVLLEQGDDGVRELLAQFAAPSATPPLIAAASSGCSLSSGMVLS